MSVVVKPHQINPVKGNNDNWKNRSEGMKCKTCMFFVLKENSKIGRCRRSNPTMKGYPVVFPDDWCGEHKIDENKLLCG